ncbi:hypothetical protein BU14_0180s0023 [Porphyra umbilicalis]|uniref:Uncharacterized protein n=1 Tax=Porphyra umbilicalis TaxID=2786 RepID=A0A1X6P747_PORUM|nr:hypothetical protein BU14_0180s0023 [Porphyra umbilicalis]|eukprot:OSX76678.1 hypothetical protein BU14_0180s0023 [Porphyra umbilicalis]
MAPSGTGRRLRRSLSRVQERVPPALHGWPFRRRPPCAPAWPAGRRQRTGGALPPDPPPAAVHGPPADRRFPTALTPRPAAPPAALPARCVRC